MINQRIYYSSLGDDVHKNINIIEEGICKLNQLVISNQFLSRELREEIFEAFTHFEISIYRTIIYNNQHLEITLEQIRNKLIDFETSLVKISAKRNNYEFIQLLHCRIVALLDFIIDKNYRLFIR